MQLHGEWRDALAEARLAVQLHDPCAVCEATAGERDHLRLRLAPTRQRVRPLVRTPRLERLLAACDHAAVDDARQERLHVAARYGDHRLVEQPQAFLDARLSDPDQPLEVRCDGKEAVIPEALADRS